jgi:hypothetical protein
MDNKENWTFLGSTKVGVKVRDDRYIGRMTKHCLEHNLQLKLGRIKLEKTHHRRKYYKFCDPAIGKLFKMFLKLSTDHITQDQVNILKMMGLRFYIVRREEEI